MSQSASAARSKREAGDADSDSYEEYKSEDEAVIQNDKEAEVVSVEHHQVEVKAEATDVGEKKKKEKKKRKDEDGERKKEKKKEKKTKEGKKEKRTKEQKEEGSAVHVIKPEVDESKPEVEESKVTVVAVVQQEAPPPQVEVSVSQEQPTASEVVSEASHETTVSAEATEAKSEQVDDTPKPGFSIETIKNEIKVVAVEEASQPSEHSTVEVSHERVSPAKDTGAPAEVPAAETTAVQSGVTVHPSEAETQAPTAGEEVSVEAVKQDDKPQESPPAETSESVEPPASEPASATVPEATPTVPPKDVEQPPTTEVEQEPAPRGVAQILAHAQKVAEERASCSSRMLMAKSLVARQEKLQERLHDMRHQFTDIDSEIRALKIDSYRNQQRSLHK